MFSFPNYNNDINQALYSPKFLIAAAKTIIHPEYEKRAPFYDIGLIKLKKSVVTSKSGPNTIKLPPSKYRLGKVATISGWGSLTVRDAPGPNVLQEAKVKILPNKLCHKHWPQSKIHGKIICAGNLGEKTGSCTGDSGGPMTDKVKGTNYLIGVVSFGQDCATPNVPQVYMEVAAFRDWIESTIKNN